MKKLLFLLATSAILCACEEDPSPSTYYPQIDGGSIDLTDTEYNRHKYDDPVVSFTYKLTENNILYIFDESKGTRIVYDFGDGTVWDKNTSPYIQVKEPIIHGYNPGKYTVTVHATNANNIWVSKSFNLTVK